MLAAWYLLVDIKQVITPVLPFVWLGTNAITMYLLAEGGFVEYVLSGFYWNDPDKNLHNLLYPTGVYWGDPNVLPDKPSYNVAVLLWTFGFIVVWMLVGRQLYNQRIFFTI